MQGKAKRRLGAANTGVGNIQLTRQHRYRTTRRLGRILGEDLPRNLAVQWSVMRWPLARFKASCVPSTLSSTLRYYLPKIARIFRVEPMPRNRVQHQKGLSDDTFERLYPDEEACRKAWFAWRWPEGFKCPRCAGSKYCEIRGRQLLQCRQCRHQTSLIAGTVLQGTKLPMRVWFRAMHRLV